jgi:hypothetical protein
MYQPYPVNPYAPPQAAAYAPPARGSHGATLTWVFGGALLGSMVLYFLGVALGGASSDDADASPLKIVGAIAVLAAIGLFLARYVVALMWLHASWSAVPPQFRMTRSGRVITPGQAVGYMFIPFYNLYWIFAANLGLADAVDYTLGACNSPLRTPRGLITAACILQVIPYVNFLVAPFFWFFAMLVVDKAKGAMFTALAAPRY